MLHFCFQIINLLSSYLNGSESITDYFQDFLFLFLNTPVQLTWTHQYMYHVLYIEGILYYYYYNYTPNYYTQFVCACVHALPEVVETDRVPGNDPHAEHVRPFAALQPGLGGSARTVR